MLLPLRIVMSSNLDEMNTGYIQDAYSACTHNSDARHSEFRYQGHIFVIIIIAIS